MAKTQQRSLKKTAFFQALGLVAYTALVGTIMMNGESLFGSFDKTPILAPIFMLSLFMTSALICGLIAFTIPLRLFWDEKKTQDALRLVAYEASFLAAFVLTILVLLIVIR